MAAELEREALTIRMSGVFDVPAARRFADALGEARGRAVHVDLTQIREFHDLAVALLARALAGRAGTTVAGLREHHVRLLAYLGIDAGPGRRDAPAELG
jgi:hypothetical protein